MMKVPRFTATGGGLSSQAYTWSSDRAVTRKTEQGGPAPRSLLKELWLEFNAGGVGGGRG